MRHEVLCCLLVFQFFFIDVILHMMVDNQVYRERV